MKKENIPNEVINLLTKDEKSNEGIFFTPKTIIKQDIDYIFSIKSDIKNILEPSCGSCEFINYLDKLSYMYTDKR